MTLGEKHIPPQVSRNRVSDNLTGKIYAASTESSSRLPWPVSAALVSAPC